MLKQLRPSVMCLPTKHQLMRFELFHFDSAVLNVHSVVELMISILQADSSHVTEKPCDDEQLSQKLSTVLKTLTLSSLNITREEEKPAYWARATKTINAVFFVFYLISVVMFLVWIFFTWTAKE